MKNNFYVLICLPLLLAGIGCQNTQSRVVEGSVIGGLLGAAAGGIIGHQSHHGGEGAAIGAAAGVVTGAIVGSQIPKDNQSNEQSMETTPEQSINYNQMSISQIIELYKQGANDTMLIEKIHFSKSKYNLTEEDINYLKSQGISQIVIDAMQGK